MLELEPVFIAGASTAGQEESNIRRIKML